MAANDMYPFVVNMLGPDAIRRIGSRYEDIVKYCTYERRPCDSSRFLQLLNLLFYCFSQSLFLAIFHIVITVNMAIVTHSTSGISTHQSHAAKMMVPSFCIHL